MSVDGAGVSRRSFLKRTTAVSLGAIAARGIYGALDDMGLAGPERAFGQTPTARRTEQYLVSGLETLNDAGVTVLVPPIYTDMVTATLDAGRTWTKDELRRAQSRLELALRFVERPYRDNAAGLTIVVAWGLPYFRGRVRASVWEKYAPQDVALSARLGRRELAVLDARTFPSDPAGGLRLEDNDVVFKFRSDSQSIVREAEQALFDDRTSRAYVGDLFDFTSKRIGFLGRGFSQPSVGKTLAVMAGVPGAGEIPDRSQLMLGFTSTQQHALGPDNLVSFETLPSVTNQWPNGYFRGGCAMHMSHLFLDLARWYGSFDYAQRVHRMFSPRTPLPSGEPVTIANAATDASTRDQVVNDAAGGLVGHNAPLRLATRLGATVQDNYGKTRPAGTSVPLREDFNTLDNPFAWSSRPGVDGWSQQAAAGMHFVVFVPTSNAFHTARLAMDGVLPDGFTNLREAPHGPMRTGLTDEDIGINAVMRATHRQNFLVPPRHRRAFPLVELDS
jgi:hypothetical protein